MLSLRITPAIFAFSVALALTQPAVAQSDSSAKAANPTSSTDAPDLSKGMEGVNADLVAARAATKEKRYADSEALMLKLTAEKPNLIVPFMELGLAQLGLKKYAEAESSFKIALGVDIKSEKIKHSEDYYNPDAPGRTKITRNTLGGFAVNEQNRTPEIKGVGFMSLGEIYIRTNRVPEAKQAFDDAIKSNPTQAAQYLLNETIFFYQIGDGADQLESANKAIALDPNKPSLYYFKGQSLVSQTAVDPKTGKLTLPPGCAEAYQKYLELEPAGQFAAESKGVLTAAGIPIKGRK
jgi:tetratricopeptide (TPR) repeat protein